MLAISPLSLLQPEGNSGSKVYSFSVSRSGDTSGTSSASWSVTGMGTTPASADDFVGGSFPSGTVVFPEGETSATISIQVAGDLNAEFDESFMVKLDAATGANLDPTALSAKR